MAKTMIHRIMCAALAAACSLALLAGCTASGPDASSDTGDSSTTLASVDFGLGLDSSGYYDGIKAADLVTLPENFTAIPLKETDVAADENEYNDFLTYIEQMAGTSRSVTDRAAEVGDTVTMNFVGTIDGKEFDGGTAQGYVIALGSGEMVDGFEEQIEGHSIEDVFDVRVTFPDNYGTTTDTDGNEIELSGKEALFEVTLTDIVEYDLTDDDVAELFGETTTMQDGTLITSVDQLYDYFMESERMTNMQNAIIIYLQENSKIEVPQSIVEQQKEVERQYAEYMATVYGYESVDEFLAANGYENMDAYISEAETAIDSNIAYRLIIQAIAENESITHADDEAYLKAFGATKNIVADTYGEGYAAQMALEYVVLMHLAETAVVS